MPTLLFVAASLAVIIAPGPDILYVVAKGISLGRRSAIVAAAGFCSGLSVHTALAAVGLSALLMASALAFSIIKYAGAAYLIYVGARAFFSSGLVSVSPGGKPMSDGRIFAQAFVMNVLNPKVAIFFLAFLPQFVRPGLGEMWVQFCWLGASFAVMAFSVLSLAGIFSDGVGRFIRTRQKLARVLDYAAGVFLIAVGLRIALLSQRSH
jgi:threonine/homoserine/homoserine lactone efflux protein